MNQDYWITLAFDTFTDFYKDEIKLQYHDFEMEIKRGTETEPHNLFIKSKRDDNKEAYEAGYKFFSELAWFYETSVDYLSSGAAAPYKMKVSVGHTHFRRQALGINLDDYESPEFTDEQRLALAIHREAINSESKFYKFLSYFRILNLRNSKGHQLVTWINENYINVKEKCYSNSLSDGIIDVGKHLYESGRCAISHASLKTTSVIANPDTYDDYYRISGEVEVIKQLAIWFMKTNLGIPDRYQWEDIVMMKYLKQAIGEDFISKVVNGQEITEIPKLPLINIKIYDSKYEYETLKRIQFDIVGITVSKQIIINNINQDSPIIFQFILDFQNNDIGYDAQQIFCKRNHPLYNAQLIIDYLTLKNSILVNNRIEFRDSETNKLISKLPVILPVNIDVTATVENNNKLIERLKNNDTEGIL